MRRARSTTLRRRAGVPRAASSTPAGQTKGPAVTPRRPTAALACLLLAAAACGGDDEPDRAVDAASPAAKAEQFTRIEEHKARCMREKGWEYTPGVYTAEDVANSPSFASIAELYRDEVERRREHGYGISLQDPAAAPQPEPATGPTEPNSRYVESLSEEEQERYWEDLAGDDGGCLEAAWNAVVGEEEIEADARRDAVITELYTAYEEDERVLRLQQRWADCMREAGYPFASREDANEHLSSRYAALTGDGPGTEEQEAAEDGAEASTTTRPVDPAALRALQEEELAIARADVACEEPLMDETVEIIEELERRVQEIQGGGAR
jgi:hypothetical protein